MSSKASGSGTASFLPRLFLVPMSSQRHARGVDQLGDGLAPLFFAIALVLLSVFQLAAVEEEPVRKCIACRSTRH